MSDDLRMLEAEVLGAVMWAPKMLMPTFMEKLRPEEFGGRGYANIAEALLALHKRGDEISPITVNEWLRERKTPGFDITTVLDVYEAGNRVMDGWGRIGLLHQRYRLRDVEVIAARLHQMAQNSSAGAAVEYGKAELERLAKMEQAGSVVRATTMTEFMQAEFPSQNWAIPRLIPSGTSLMLTATEGMGKSVFLRQLAVSAACGIDPFDPWDRQKDYAPRRALIIDGEYTPGQIQRQLREVGRFAEMHAEFGHDQMDRIAVQSVQGRFDLTDPADQGLLRGWVRDHRPDLLLIGPLYLITSRGYMDEDDTRKFQRPLEALMAEGLSVVLEHHIGNEGPDGRRSLRPIGSSALRRWASQGIGLRRDACETHTSFDCTICGRRGSLERWRGARDETWWPECLKSPQPGTGYWWLHDEVREALAA